MPKLGLTMKTGKVARWLVAEGACVHQGDEIFEVETDKITNKVESPADGVLVRILVPQGEVVEVGTVLGLLGEAGEAVDAPAQSASAPAAAPAGDAEEKGAASPAAVQAAAPAQASDTSWILATPRARALSRFLELDLRHVTPTGANGRIREADVIARQDVLSRIAITPLARVLASQAGLDICTLTGSGEGGKIVRADVERALNPEAAQAAPAAAAVESAAADVREMVLDECSGASPVRTLSATVDVTACQQLLGDMKRLGAQYKKAAAALDLGLLMALVAARTLAAHPALNAVYGNGRLVRERSVQLALRTMPAGSEALLSDAQGKGLLALASDRQAAGAGSSTFVLTSYAGSRVERATPALGAGQAAGLVLGAPVQRAVSCNGSLTLREACDVTLGYDARLVTDAEACAFMDALVAAADNPLLLVF